MDGRAPVAVFVARHGNEFMRELAGWLVEAALAGGRRAQLVLDRLPADDGSVNLVVAPHELFTLTAATRREVGRAAAASICVGTEQPGTAWFETTVELARRGRLAFDINRSAVAELRSCGVDAHPLQLGAVPSMTAGELDGERSTDVVFLGALDERRAGVLAGLAAPLARRRVDLRMFPPDRPVGHATPGLLFGQAKHRLLASSKVLLNLHRDRPGEARPAYFEWVRAVEAMANGCLVVGEPSDDVAPLLPGVHLVEAQADELPATLERALDDDRWRHDITRAAYQAVTGELALTTSLAEALELAEAAAGRPMRRVRPVRAARATRPPRLPVFQPHLHLHREAKRLARAEDALLRRLDAAQCLLRHGAAQALLRWATPAWAACTPDVTVVVPVHDAASTVVETLDSIAASEDVAFELVVVDDHATDTSRDVVRHWFDANPQVPALLLAKEANEGLSAARNTGFQHARADLVMPVDADNLVLPTCLRRLADALADDDAAAAAYSVLADFGEARGVRSAFAWDVDRLCRANYLDAQALWRLGAWRELGGYRPDDDTVYGWEDWDLWLRLAASGGHAVLVRQVLGCYRVRAGSMVSLSNLAADDARAAIRARYPSLPWPA